MTVHAQLTVSIEGTLEAEAGAAVLASLPVSFAATTDSATAEVTVLDGRRPDWPDRLAAASGRVIVVDPCPTAHAGGGLPFLLDTPWGSNPVCEAAAAALRSHSWERLECRSIVAPRADPRQSLLHLVSLSRAVGVVLDSLRILVSADTTVAATGSAAGRTVDLAVAATDALASRAVLRALTTDGDVSVTIPAPRTARPAELVVTDVNGSLLSPTIWETSHRASWRRALLAPPPDDSAAFDADSQLVRTAFARKVSVQ